MTNSLSKTDLEEHRSLFPGLKGKHYFNFGGQGTMPKTALAAIMETHQYIQQVGPFSRSINSWLTAKTKSLRRAIAGELETTAQTITLTENVTVGCNIALWGLDWQPGERILMTDCEHPGIVATVQELSRRFSLEVSICPILETLNQGNPVEIIQRHLTANTRLVILSHLLWNTGQILPLKKIMQACHGFAAPRKIRVLVDAAQSVGSLDLNLPDTGVDFYAFTGHKWLCGPGGVGGLYVSKAATAELNPTFIGWRGIEMDDHGNPIAWNPDGSRLEVATSAYAEYAGLEQAIATHQAWGSKSDRYQRICKLSNFLWSELGKIPQVSCLKITPPEAGLVSFRVEGQDHGQLVDTLEEQGYLLRTIANPDCIRACVHYLTLESEIEHLLEAMENVL